MSRTVAALCRLRGPRALGEMRSPRAALAAVRRMPCPLPVRPAGRGTPGVAQVSAARAASPSAVTPVHDGVVGRLRVGRRRRCEQQGQRVHRQLQGAQLGDSQLARVHRRLAARWATSGQVRSSQVRARSGPGQGQVRVRSVSGQGQVRVRSGSGQGQGQVRVRSGSGQVRSGSDQVRRYKFTHAA